LIREIPIFLSEYVKANTADLENQLHDPEFLRELAFLSNITGHLNDLNLKVQGKEQTVSNLFGYINGFRNKLKIFKVSLEKNELAHFHACKELAEKLENDNGSDFSVFASNIENIMQEFNSRFADFEDMRDSIVLFNNRLGVNIEDQPTQFQLELYDLQADPFLQTRVEKGL
jgi:septation ring formation regulator EzrA